MTITGSTATLAFASSNVQSSVSTSPGTFSQGGTVFTFTVFGVDYTGAPSTTTATGGLIESVVVTASNGGPTVTAALSAPASHVTFGIGHDEVGFQLS